MRLEALVVPAAGEFRQGIWNGREFIVVQRRLFPAIVCWLIGALVLGWVCAAVLWPKSDYVPEPDHFRALEMVLWKRTWIADPGSSTLSFRSGFIARTEKVSGSEGGFWVQVHPIEIAIRGAFGWRGYAAVLHATPAVGVAISASASEAGARDHAQVVADTLRIRSEGQPGDALSATV